jgi:cysteinyl-tRNA synthetase
MSISQDITFYNSLTQRKERFEPISKSKYVSLYTCGPTIYDYAHIGNFRAFLTYDVLKRTLQYFGYEVDHICNLTDIDDKIIARCDRENLSLKELTNKYETLFIQDLEALNIVKARAYPRATDHITEMVQLVKELHQKGLAYQSEEGSWYFDVAAKDGYGSQLVKLDIHAMKKGASGVAGTQRMGDIDADEYDADKIGLRDFALWKAFKPNFDRLDATWETEIGKGRPGWHLECSAMARKFLGDTIDLHCGTYLSKVIHHRTVSSDFIRGNYGLQGVWI